MKTPQTSTSNTTASFSRASVQLLGTTALVTVLFTSTAMANPAGGVVAAGNANIVTSGNTLNVNQSTNKAVINWGSFNIAPNETTNFNQPSANSVTLNRVGGANPSQILGNLNANGQVMVVNPNGVFFGTNAKVDVGSLVATTSDINDSDFMSATSKYAFSKSGKSDAQVVNNGTITVDAGGHAVLAGPSVTNNGTINANLGKVALAGTDTYTIDLNGDKLINFSLPTGTTKSGPAGSTATVNNNGAIFADGGKVQLSAQSASNAINSIVNMDGIVEAKSSSTNKGTVSLSGDRVNIGGNIDVSGQGNASGGTIRATGGKYLAMTGDIKAEGGATGGNGGLIHLQGNPLVLGGNASVGAANGTGGKAEFKSGNVFDINEAEAYTIANTVRKGGDVDVSGLKTINLNANIDARGSDAKKATLNFLDGNGNGTLDVNLKKDIALSSKAKLTGDAVEVNVVNDDAEIQDGIKVAANGATVNVGAGYYDEIVHMNKDGVKLNAVGAPGTDSAQPGWTRPEIAGYVDVTADNTTVNGFLIKGGIKDGEWVGVNIKDADNTRLTNNHVRLVTKGQVADASKYRGTGVKLDNADGTYIADNRINGVTTGIKLTNSDNVTIYDNSLKTTDTNIDGRFSDNLKVNFNNLEGIGGNSTGIKMDESDNLKVTNNLIRDHKAGIVVTDSNSPEVSNNTINRVKYALGVDNSDNLVYFNNNVTGDNSKGSYGLYLEDSDNAYIADNRIENVQKGVRMVKSNNATIYDNTFNTTDTGIEARFSDDLDVTFNNIEGAGSTSNSKGINVDESDNLKVSNNLIRDHRNGVIVTDSANPEISNNTITRIKYGVGVDNTTNMVYDSNTVNGDNTKGYGLYVEDSSNVQVTDNTHTNVQTALKNVNSDITVESGNNF